MSNNPERGHNSCSPSDFNVVIGKVISINIPRRELRIAPDTSHPERFHLLRQLRLKTRGNKEIVLPVVSVRLTAKVAIVTIETTSDDELASAKGADIVIPHSERFQLPANEYYVDDLLGLTVKDTAGQVIGKLEEIWWTPANDIYRVLDEEGRETLLPAIEDVIVSVDIGRGELTADLSLLK